MINNRVQVFVHSAEHPGEIDINRAKEALERAEESCARSSPLPNTTEARWSWPGRCHGSARQESANNKIEESLKRKNAAGM
ncbi:MAG: hypothetical protein ACLUOI_09670 [Eisenbergiella sp.]